MPDPSAATPRRRMPAPRWMALRLTAALCVILVALVWSGSARAATCGGGDLAPQGLTVGGQPDLKVDGPCTVNPGVYKFNVVNVVKGGSLTFKEVGLNAVTEFWANTIIVEAGGAILAGVDADAPFGKDGGRLTFYLYGADRSNGNPIATPGQSPVCATVTDPEPAGADNYKAIGPCGIPWQAWKDNGKNVIPLPGGREDYFYQYGGLYGDTAAGPKGVGYFGYKSIGVSYDGTIRLRGWKGTTQSALADADATQSGTAWIRLANGRNLAENAGALVLERSVAGDWKKGDQIVVTTTDYLPGHSEEVKISADPTGATVSFGPLLKYAHNGTRYPLKARLGTTDAARAMDPTLLTAGGETRAAVALLNRSIQIVSAGNAADRTFEQEGSAAAPYSFGGHVVFRQGFRAVQIQGVEFKQLGQGGKMGHYPVHFHMARKTAPGTYIKDSSVNESMTRWIVLHSTSDVLLARNVGYKSIGHGFYLESGTETDNKFHSNIGILARSASYGALNPRRVPGILAANNMGAGDDIRYTSDVKKPSIFWIMNGWNDFVGNMAVGAGACGACYWLLPGRNSDHVDVMNHDLPHPASGHQKMSWTGYAAVQETEPGGAPLKTFFKNTCSSAMHSITTVGEMAECLGFAPPPAPGAGPTETDRITPVRSIAADQPNEMYYPNISSARNATLCNPPGSCSSVKGVVNVIGCSAEDPKNCPVTVLDHYTTSFNWGHYNFASVWLRSKWYLVDNSVITDQMSGGLTFVSGGDYTRSSAPEGYWAMVSRSVFAGQTQPTGKYTPAWGALSNGRGTKSCTGRSDACVNIDESVTVPLVSFGTSQRLFNIYDGPAYQDANAYLDITTTPCLKTTECMYGRTAGLRRDPSKPEGAQAYMPNAAIGWKQPNAFYYPPAFRSSRLFFDKVDIRHYLVEPLLLENTYLTDITKVKRQYAGEIDPPLTLMSGFTDVDRQTELTDNDGSLTGLVRVTPGNLGIKETISVNKDPFFNAPIETDQCRSNLGVAPTNACSGVNQTRATAKTSPYEYVTTVVYPGCALGGDSRTNCGSYDDLKGPVCTQQDDPLLPPGNKRFVRCTESPGRGGEWSKNCGGPFCFGVPIYRQFLTGLKDQAAPTAEWEEWKTRGCFTDPKAPGCAFPFARMAGMSLFQRSVMTLNNATYFIDTAVSRQTQRLSEFAGLYANRENNYVECDPTLRPIGFCEPRAVNEFRKSQPYYFFLVYARATTRQTYQMYVGDGFDPARHLKVKRVVIEKVPFRPIDANLTPAQAGWTVAMLTGADGKKSVLEVTVDLKRFADELNPRKVGNGTCKPVEFCNWNGSTCGCSLKPDDPRLLINPGLKASCESVCGTWATRDLDCPKGGCLGFEVTMSPNFVANNLNHRPEPKAFPAAPAVGDRYWATTFGRTTVRPDSVAPTSTQSASSCYYPSIPGTDCPVPRVDD